MDEKNKDKKNVGNSIAMLLLKESIESGKTIKIPSLGIEFKLGSEVKK